MRIYLVTGVQGFVGRYLCARILRSDPHAFILGLGRSPRSDNTFTHSLRLGSEIVPALIPAGLIFEAHRRRYEYVSVDVCDSDALRELLDEFEPAVVFHLASALRGDTPTCLRESTLQSTIGLFEAMDRSTHRVERVVLG